MMGRRMRERRAGGGKLKRPSRRFGVEQLEQRVLLAADSTVVFSELMYHPDGDQALEWIELHNEMATNMDISQWQLDGGVQFEFDEGTVINGGEYLLIAADPTQWPAESALDDAMGPYTGQLANGGEEILLRDASGRVMDTLDYDDADPWPIGADGAGVSLAKLAMNTSSEKAENWAGSSQLGGTPGELNFPGTSITPVATTPLVSIADTWNYDLSGADLGATWREPGFDDSGWTSSPTVSPPVLITEAGTSTPDYFEIQNLSGSTIDTTGWIAVANSAANYEINDVHSPVWSFPGAVTPGEVLFRPDITGDNIFWRSHDRGWLMILNGEGQIIDFVVWGYTSEELGTMEIAAGGFTNLRGDTAWIGAPVDTSTATSDALQRIGNIDRNNAIDWTFDSSGTPNAQNEEIELPFVGQSMDFPPGESTYYFRSEFDFSDSAALTELTVNLILDDGGVFYLNGQEVYRHNMPAGPITHDTPATSEVDPVTIIEGIPLPSYALVQGTNVLAVEVHQSTDNNTDATFNMELIGTLWPPDWLASTVTLALNEVGADDQGIPFVELVNYGDMSLPIGDYAIRSSDGFEYVLPDQFLAAGDQLALSPSDLGFTPVAGERLYLFAFDGQLFVDAARVEDVLRGRLPEGTGRWLYPDQPTPGGPNSFALHDEIVINEIMYHHAPLSYGPTTTLLPIEAVWAYEDSGVDLGTSWRESAFNDATWATGPALLYVEEAAMPAPKNTPLALGPNTHYFRTEFDFTGDPAEVELRLRHIVDDGAVFYLNGQEVERFNMPEGVVDYDTFASGSVVNSTYSSTIVLPTEALLVGQNVLAVEVHQWLVGSADVVFGAELTIAEPVAYSAPSDLFQPSQEEWLELYNRGNTTIDLGGWQLDDAVEFTFAPGTLIGPGEYLVVAEDLIALQNKYPAVTMVGNYSGRLSNTDERILLVDPTGNPADEVHYYDTRNWPEYADGGGSSLELRDPDADNSAAEAWAASDESDKSVWQTVSYGGIAQYSPASSNPSHFQEFLMGLLDAGEFLIDDISVIENGSIQMIQNGSFTTGTGAWRIQGNHFDHGRTGVVGDPDNPGNNVLHVTATGNTEHNYNQLETTFTSGQTIVNGYRYDISFRAKWLGGSNQLHTRLYFNRLPHTERLEMPSNTGTPGAENSRFQHNIGPTYTGLQHGPIMPAASETVSVSVAAADPDGVAAMTLWYLVNSGSFNSVAMTSDGDGNYSAEIPGQAAAATVQFYVEGTDSQGATSTFPPAGPDSRALYKVEDGKDGDGPAHNFRLIMKSQDSTFLTTGTQGLTRHRLGGTVVFQDQVYYDVGIRTKGSPYTRGNTMTGYNVRFYPDNLFRGAHDVVAIDRWNSWSGNGISQREVVLKHIMNRAGVVPSIYDELIYFIPPDNSYTGPAQLNMARYDDAFLDGMFANGNEGTRFKLEAIYYPTTTIDGNPQSPKIRANAAGPVGIDIWDMGDDKESYRRHYLIKSHRQQDDFSRMIELGKTFSMTGSYNGSDFDIRSQQIIDVDQWMQMFALLALGGTEDLYHQGYWGHNFQMFVRPEDDRIIALPWDMDGSLTQPTNLDLLGPIMGSIGKTSNFRKVLEIPNNLHYFYGHINDIIETSYNLTYLGEWIDHYQPFTTWNETVAIRNYINGRRAFALSRFPAQQSFGITTSGADLTVDEATITLAGTGWINVREVFLNGSTQPLDIVWTDTTHWQTTIPIGYGDNELTFEARDYQGVVLGSQTITAHSTISQRPLQDFLRITEMNYNPSDPSASENLAGFTNNDDFEFIELTNTGPFYLDLTGARFTDGIDFDFTAAGITSMGPGEYVVLACNPSAFAERYGSVPNLIGPYSGRLNNGGEDLRLLDSVGGVIHEFTYGDSGTAGWPDRADGNGATLQIIDMGGDYNDPANWRSSSEYFGSPGSEGSARLAGVVVNEVLTHTPDSPLPPGEGQGEGLLVDAIELYNPTGSPVVLDGWWLSDSAGDLLKFQIPVGTTIPAYGYWTFYEGHYEGLSFVVDQANEFGGTGEKDFALSGARGDDVWLLADFGNGSPLLFADHVEFGGALVGESFGRWPNGTGELYPMNDVTLGGPNSGPRLPQRVIFSEIMYNPPGDDVPDYLEYLELANFTGQPVDLTGWQLSGGFDYDFPPSTTLDANGELLVVSFDPYDTAMLDDFRTHYGLGPEVLILGNPNDTLDDLGELIRLERNDDPPDDDPLYVPHLIEDQIDFLSAEYGPWYPTANGGGHSLHRIGAATWGNDASSWTPDTPTPGDASLAVATEVVGRYVFYNNSAYDETSDADAIVTDKTALLPGEQATSANYTSYTKGINGIIIDVARLADPGAIDENDFTFKIGNDDTPSGWLDAPTPSIDVTAGPSNTSRISLIWPNGAIRNTWLEVTVLATENTGLDTADVFYFGNAVGETGNCTTCAAVDAVDVLLTRQNPQPFFDPAAIDNVYDFNRDRRVDAIDTLIARNNQTWSGTELELIDLAAKGAVQSEAKNAGPISGNWAQPLGDAPLNDVALRAAFDWLYEVEADASSVKLATKDDPSSDALGKLWSDGRAG